MLPQPGQLNPGVLIENRWTSWAQLTKGTALRSNELQLALLRAGRGIRQRLRLRGEPFRFRSTGAEVEVQAVGVAGAISIMDTNFEVAPKFLSQHQLASWNTSSLFLMEALAGRHVISLLAERQQWRSHSVADLMAHAFTDAVERGLREQPIHTYRQTEEVSSVLRGRLNISRQIKTATQAPHLLECDVDQLDAENGYNDVLKWAALTLSDMTRDRDVKERLRRFLTSFPGNPERSPTYRHIRLVPPPQFRVWGDALELARLLAAGMTLSTVGGRSSGYSLMFNMERAFEKFVELGVERSLGAVTNEQVVSSRQLWSHFGDADFPGGRPLFCRPDNVIRQGKDALLVVDAKYKVLDDELWAASFDKTKAAPLGADVYELITGMIANHCTTGLLVYPSGMDKMPAAPRVRSWTVNAYGTQLRIGVLPISLMGLASRADLTRAHTDLAIDVIDFALRGRTAAS